MDTDNPLSKGYRKNESCKLVKLIDILNPENKPIMITIITTIGARHGHEIEPIPILVMVIISHDVPMVIISHERAFFDKLRTKIVETVMSVSRTFIENYSDYIIGKATWIEAQFTTWEKQQKEINHIIGLISMLSARAISGNASSIEKVFLSHKLEVVVEKWVGRMGR
ncbi:ABC transporter family protein [Artemisia annua]|uniref:ABC transporter family protein n=1 Tax=Artemisia annua TaxID=35608 RepID=A0A2U1LPU1_ARTAN|nr:ABC transporter family protein [Artemisia annua]